MRLRQPHRQSIQFARPARSDPGSEGGFAMLLTVIVMMIVMVLVTVVFSQGMQSQPLARQGQNYQAALQAAESGIQDYIDRLDNNTTYYLLNNTDATNPAMRNGLTWQSPPTSTRWAA